MRIVGASLVDPNQWTEVHVNHWITWAIREFNLVGVSPDSFNITGKELCEMQHADFVHRVPHDKGDVFWTHLELLRKCKFVGQSHGAVTRYLRHLASQNTCYMLPSVSAVVQQPTPMAVHTVTVSTGELGRSQPKVGKVRSSRIIGDGIATGVRTGTPYSPTHGRVQ